MGDDGAGLLVVVHIAADGRRVVLAPDNEHIQTYGERADTIRTALRWLREYDIRTAQKSPWIDADWGSLQRCLSGGDERCAYHDNYELVVTMVVLVCTRFRCADPGYMTSLLWCVLANDDHATYLDWRFKLLRWQLRLVELQQRIWVPAELTQAVMRAAALRGPPGNVHTCDALVDGQPCSETTSGPLWLRWCTAHTPIAFGSEGRAPVMVPMHPLPKGYCVTAYFEDRWAKAVGWSCLEEYFKNQVQRYKTMSAPPSTGWFVLRFVNVRRIKAKEIVKKVVVPHLEDLLNLKNLRLEYLMHLSTEPPHNHTKEYNLKALPERAFPPIRHRKRKKNQEYDPFQSDQSDYPQSFSAVLGPIVKLLQVSEWSVATLATYGDVDVIEHGEENLITVSEDEAYDDDEKERMWQYEKWYALPDHTQGPTTTFNDPRMP